MIQTDHSSISYVGNNSIVVPYPVDFYFFDDTDLQVVAKDTVTGVEDPLILNTDFTVTGEGDPNGGNLLTTFPVPATSTLTIFRDVPATQLTSYEEADAFPAKSHERALDKLTMLVQQALRVTGSGGGSQSDVGRAFRLSEASGGINAVAKLNDTTLGLDSMGNAVLRAPSEMLSWLGQVGTVWANTAARQVTRGAYAGQLGVQLDNFTIYIAHSTQPGDWTPFLSANGLVTSASGVPGAMAIPAGDIVGTLESQQLYNKSLITPSITDPTGLDKNDVGLGNVDNTADLDKPISAAQTTAIANKENKSEKGFPNGYAALDGGGKVPTSQLPPSTGGVTSVNTRTGDVVLSKADVGLANADNTSDAGKPVSTATQTALNLKEDKANKNIANGYPSLDGSGKIPLAQIPDSVIGASQYQGTWNATTNTPTIPTAAAGNKGWYYSVAVAGTTNINGINSWAVGDQIISNGSVWQKIVNVSAVSSVNSKTGAVVIDKTDVGLANVDNTSDANKPVSTATTTALAAKQDTSQKGTANGYASLDATGKVPAAQLTIPPDAVTSVAGKTGVVTLAKGDVGLGNVDNTSDATKNSAVATLTNKTIDGASNTLNVRLGSDVSGNLPVSRLNGGTGADATTWWCGDSSWKKPPGTGDVNGPAVVADNDVAVFSGTTGKIIKTTGRQAGNLVDGPANSADGEVAVFNGTTGKQLKRGTALPVGAIVGTTDTQTLSNKSLVEPLIVPAAGATAYRASGMVYVNTATVFTVGTAVTDLHVYNMPAGMMARDGDCLKITTWLNTSANTNSKTFYVTCGSETVYSRTSTAWNNVCFKLVSLIFRVSPTSQNIISDELTDAGTIQLTKRTTISQTLANALNVKVSAKGAASNDWGVYMTMVEFVPAP